jgi:hypothetical protein
MHVLNLALLLDPHNLRASDIKRAMGEIDSYHERD